jgi:hypothetical protein
MTTMHGDSAEVHVGEVHTHVVAHDGHEHRPSPHGVVPGLAEAGWSETRGRLEWIEARTRAEGFDD